jgi:hypothetical protein
MAETFISVAGKRATSGTLELPYSGAWIADVKFDELITLTGVVSVTFGKLTLRGTIDPNFSGGFQLGSVARIVAGADGWRKIIPAKPYHNDAGIRATVIATDIARQVGETLATQGDVGRVGVDYVSQRGPASWVLDSLYPLWWVDAAGVTQLRASTVRPPVEVAASAYDLLTYDPGSKVATLALDDPSLVGIGTVIRGRLEAPIVVRALSLTVEKSALRVNVWGAPL